jgi:hypothetical protein
MSAHSAANVPVTSLPPPAKKVLFYGTSIMNGAAANRPGMGYPQQAERMLGMEGINIGFGSDGKFQPYYPASHLLSEIAYDIAVLDPHYNMVSMPPMEIYNLTLAFVGDLKAQKPTVPVLLLEGHTEGTAWINSAVDLEMNQTREAYRRAYNTMLKAGIAGIYFGRGETKFGGTVILILTAMWPRGVRLGSQCCEVEAWHTCDHISSISGVAFLMRSIVDSVTTR